MSDLISRQAAIDAIERLQMPIMRSQDNAEQFKFTGMAEAREAIIGLPSAQPALDEWCTDCKEYDQERHCCPRWNRVIRTALDDARKELSPAQPEIIRCNEYERAEVARWVNAEKPISITWSDKTVRKTKLFCRKSGYLCEFATEHGYCQIAVCVKEPLAGRRIDE